MSDVCRRNITLRWHELQKSWNASADKRFGEQLKLTKAPCIMHEDEYELTRYEFFEEEYNVSMEPPPINTNGEYKLTFNTGQDLTMFILKWL